MIQNTKDYMGERKFSYYNAMNNNCQVLISSILKSNGLLTETNLEFVKQDIKKLLKQEKSLRYLGKTATDLGAVLDRITTGNGVYL